MDNLEYLDPLGRNVILIKEDNKLHSIKTSLFSADYLIKCDALKLGILGDLHGHITLGLRKLKEWENYSGLKLDAILQVGDLGLFDEQTCLDLITKEMALKDPDELGFLNYFKKSKEADEFFGENGYFQKTPFYFISGNHDDIFFHKRNNVVSEYDNFIFIEDGNFESIKKNKDSFTIGSLGYYHTLNHHHKLLNHKVDILLTHVSPTLIYNVNSLLKEKLRSKEIKYCFFGHHHDGAFSEELNLHNQYGLNEVRIKRNELKKGCIGFLEISSLDSKFIYLPNTY